MPHFCLRICCVLFFVLPAGNPPPQFPSVATHAGASATRFNLISVVRAHAPAQIGAVRSHADDSLRASKESGWFSGAWTVLRRWLLPVELNLIYDLRAHISSLPLQERSREADLRRVDEIYARAVYLAEGDAVRAMLACAWATLPYHTFPARIPLLGIGLRVPVSTESKAAYNRRMARLPGKLFADSPRGLDRDKLPHFFGSAWLQLVTRTPDLVVAAGELLELSEAVFKLEGARDPRDIAINRLGVCFARQLQQQRDVRPSEILKLGLNTDEHCAETQNPPR